MARRLFKVGDLTPLGVDAIMRLEDASHWYSGALVDFPDDGTVDLDNMIAMGALIEMPVETGASSEE